MATTLASLVVRIGSDVSGVTAGLSTLDKRIRRSKRQFGQLRDSTLRWQDALKVLAGAGGLAFASTKLFEWGAAAEETASKFRTTLGPATAETQAFLDDFAASAGLTAQKGQDLVATTAAIVQGMGFSQKASAGFAEEVTRLAGDLSSFNNIPIADTSRAIQAALTGEREQLKRYGIVVRETDVQQRALAMTGKATAEALTQQEKATATLELITQRAGVAVGDLARTMDSPANRARKIVSEFLTLRDTLSQALLPAFSVFLEELAGLSGAQGLAGLTRQLRENSARIEAWARFVVISAKTAALAFAAPIRVLFNFGQVLGNVGQALARFAKGDLAGAKAALEDLEGNRDDLTRAITDVVDGFDDMVTAADIAWRTERDLADQVAETAAAVASEANELERAAEVKERMADATTELNRLLEAEHERLAELREGWRQNRLEMEKHAAFMDKLPATLTPHATPTGAPDPIRGGNLVGQLQDVFKVDITQMMSTLGGNLGAMLVRKVGDELGDLFADWADSQKALKEAIEQNTRALRADADFLAERVMMDEQLAAEARLLLQALTRFRNLSDVGDLDPGMHIRRFVDEFMREAGVIGAGEFFSIGKFDEALGLDTSRIFEREILDQLIAQLDKVVPHLDEFTEAVEDVADASAEAERHLRAMESITVRALRAMGDTARAELASLQFGHRQELLDAPESDREALRVLHSMELLALKTQQQIDEINSAAREQIEILDAQLAAHQDQLQLVQAQLAVAEQTVDTLRAVASSLTSFRESLLLGPLSPLSPSAQLEEARSQFAALAQLALGGDVSAAQSLPDAARALLELSRAFFASGLPYVEEFNRVQETIAAITDGFLEEIDVQELMLTELKRQTTKLNQQISLIRSEIDAVRDGADDMVAKIQATHSSEMNRLASILSQLTGILLASDRTASNTGTELQIARSLVHEYERVVIPSIHRFWTNLVDEKDRVHQAQLLELVRALNNAQGTPGANADFTATNRLQTEVVGLRSDLRNGFDRLGALLT